MKKSKPCFFPGCNEPAYRRDACRDCYEEKIRTNKPEPVEVAPRMLKSNGIAHALVAIYALEFPGGVIDYVGQSVYPAHRWTKKELGEKTLRVLVWVPLHQADALEGVAIRAAKDAGHPIRNSLIPPEFVVLPSWEGGPRRFKRPA